MSITGGLIFAWFSGLAFSEWPGTARKEPATPPRASGN
jgi:hypothetical protein